MKKLFLIFTSVLFLSTNLFADYILRQNFSGPGTILFIDNNCFTYYEDNYVSNLSPFNGLNLTAAYEFNSDPEATFHPYIGGTVGLKIVVLSTCATSGVNITLADLGDGKLELDAGADIGAITDLIWGETNFYTNPYINAVFQTRADRKGFFFSTGIEFPFTFNLNIYKTYGVHFVMEAVPCFNFAFGYRFP